MAVRYAEKWSLFMRSLCFRSRTWTLGTAILAFSCMASQASVNVYFAASAPASLQTELIAALTSQYLVQLTPSSYFPNTYTATVTGINPSYQCGGTVTVNVPCQLDMDVNNMVAVSTYTGTYMFGSGMVYQQDQQESFVAGMGTLCGSATSYNLIRTTTTTFNTATCQDVTGTILNELYNEQLSTPTVIPPEDAL